MHIQCISWTNILHTKVEEQPGTQLLLNEPYSNPASNVESESGQLQKEWLLQHHSSVLYTAEYVHSWICIAECV